MMSPLVLAFLITFSISVAGQKLKTATECLGTADLPWSYSRKNKNGPQYWRDTDKVCAYERKNQRQSPINIQESYSPNRTGIETNYQFIGYDEPMTGIMYNTGANLVLYPGDCVERYLMWNGERCDLKHLVFHFSAKNMTGSDHKFEGKQYSMEIDMANECESGDVILGILFLETKQPTPRVQSLADVAKLVVYRGDSAATPTPINLLNLTDTLCYDEEAGTDPFGQNMLYAYEGSYMYPPCTENVTWLIQETTSDISVEVMTAFRALRASNRTSEEQCYLYPMTRYPASPNNRVINHTLTDCGQSDGFIDQASGMALGCNSMTGVDNPMPGEAPEGGSPSCCGAPDGPPDSGASGQGASNSDTMGPGVPVGGSPGGIMKAP